MSFSVVWLPVAEQSLARIYNEAADKQEITRAANEIDRWLRLIPAEVGESREGESRVTFCSPLAITYRVIREDRRVEVGHVWRIR
jgi:hypothetical protein